MIGFRTMRLNRRCELALVVTTLAATSVHAQVALTIPQIQGSGHVSPFAGQAVSGVDGVVTAIVSTGSARGFYMQDPRPGGDGDLATSDGLFVFTGSTTPSVTVGQRVVVSGNVTEFRSGCNNCTPTNSAYNNLSLTEITAPQVTISAAASPGVPAAIILGGGGRTAPNAIGTGSGVSVESATHVFNINTQAIDFFESLEGMRVSVQNPIVVGPRNGFGEIPLVADLGVGAPLPTARGGVAVSAGNFNGTRVIVDDPLIGSANMPQAKVGDRLQNVVGVMDYSFANYKLLLTTPPTLTAGALAKEVAANAGAGQVSIASFNVENLAGNSANSKFAALARQIVINLKAPDIISLSEIQDDNGATDNGIVSANATFSKLIAAISAAGGPTYQFAQIDPANGQDGGAPGGNIRVGMLFNPATVGFAARAGGGTDIAVTINGDGSLQQNPGRVDPTNPAWVSVPPGSGEIFGFDGARKPLAAEFTVNGQRLILIANHFKSKSQDQPLFGRFQEPVQFTSTQRKAQAESVAAFVRSLIAADADARIVVLGDMNDFQFSDTLAILEAAGLSNLYDLLAAAERYSYVFDGDSQALDHILISDALADFAEFDVVHVNSEFVAADRASDHDPLLLRLNLQAAEAVSAPATAGLLLPGLAWLLRRRSGVAESIRRNRR